MKSKLMRKFLSGFSLTTALFVFQACYGGPQDYGMDVLVEGQVKAKSSGTPIEGIKVSVAENMQYMLTDSLGKFSFYTNYNDNIRVLIEDIDVNQNGMYKPCDTLLTNAYERVYLDIVLEEV